MAKTKKTWTPEQKEKQSTSMKKAWTDPDTRTRISDAIKARLADPEIREKMKAGHARRRAERDAAKAAAGTPPVAPKAKGKPGPKPKAPKAEPAETTTTELPPEPLEATAPKEKAKPGPKPKTPSAGISAAPKQAKSA